MAFCLMPLTCTFDVSAITLPVQIMVSATCFLKYGYQNLDQIKRPKIIGLFMHRR